MFKIQTDLALETRELVQKGLGREIEGVEVEERKEFDDKIKITKVKVNSIKGEAILQKPMGNYITIEADGLRDEDFEVQEQVSKILANELESLINVSQKSTVLVVGLGNWDVTPDSLGPKVVSKVLITRHLFEFVPEKIKDRRIRSVCAISPGVMGITGIETSEIIGGIVQRIHPDLIIAIDALASRRLERISTAIQIADTGIVPGSGIGNERKGITKETVGVPVVAIGVPMVVDAAIIANDAIDLLLERLKNETDRSSPLYMLLESIPDEDRFNLIKEVIFPYYGNLFVTPKDIDRIVENISTVIADGINKAIHPEVKENEEYRYVN
ncbi:spore protease [Caldicellulosiruptor bescii]|uniref:Spore protease n=2 Tax=Caldicellulosiruptor bescii TaxID=31899 RepID=B9MKM5_CALBD|nr:GPR endopeptidase [Caldicellulosiruptor bescii]ACM60883.1 spore protease [Caldicellulosiruptor bescii DSM 6725]PBC89299.1 spore protease [Caldicellulosiruptor bescii]PBC91216.1 spore protease [Caldicellulosiruptor bescii]PBD03370.1 spore protease [Caldicellulosiruptor bescii]PBD07015.1 spore protease [Caldicellulosiruptor bescii]